MLVTLPNSAHISWTADFRPSVSAQAVSAFSRSAEVRRGIHGSGRLNLTVTSRGVTVSAIATRLAIACCATFLSASL